MVIGILNKYAADERRTHRILVIHRDDPPHEKSNEGVQSNNALKVILIYHGPVWDKQCSVAGGYRIITRANLEVDPPETFRINVTQCRITHSQKLKWSVGHYCGMRFRFLQEKDEMGYLHRNLAIMSALRPPCLK